MDLGEMKTDLDLAPKDHHLLVRYDDGSFVVWKEYWPNPRWTDGRVNSIDDANIVGYWPLPLPNESL